MARSNAILLALLALPSFGCGTDTATGERPLFLRGVNNLTIIIYDGITGAGVNDAQVRLNVGPHVLTASNTEHVYNVTQIPQGSFVAFVEAPGYLAAAAQLNFNQSGDITSPYTDHSYITRIAVLYPLDSAEQDIVVRAHDASDGTPIQTGKMVASLDRDAAFDFLLGGEVDNDLILGTGLRPSSIEVDIDNTGSAVLPKNQLVLGLTYDINIYGAQDQGGNPLQPVQDIQVQAGYDYPEVVVFMAPPPETPVALSANNEEGSGQSTLVVNFPYDVAVCSDPASHAWFDPLGTDRDGDTNPTTPHATEPVVITPSNNDTTLTIAYQSALEDTDDELTVQFSGIAVQAKGARTCTPLGSVPIRNSGGFVNTTIDVR